jgi:5'-3' exonuclease
MNTYLLVDTANTFFRARHAAHRASDTLTKLGFALHVTMMSVNKCARRFAADHIVFALEGRSWRKDYYKPYKANRAETRGKMNQTEQEEDQLFWETYDALTAYLSTKTNCSVIRHAEAEADDVIARWIALHPQDQHIVISSDSDFVQCISPTVKQYNGITDELITMQGIFDAKGKPIIDRKTQQPKAAPDPAWLLFEKCMRGDVSDNVFSAYPGVREKGTKNKTGLREAFADRERRGYSWNNLMLQRWVDHNGSEHKVLDDYERNRVLIDLTAQPDNIKQAVDQAIVQQISAKDIGQVGAHFMRFCGRYELIKMSESADQISRWLNQTYQGVLNDHSQTSD